MLLLASSEYLFQNWNKITINNINSSYYFSLCGAATDLALRCIVNGNKTKQTDFFLIAVCCHHRCTWKPFVGKKFMLENGITPRSFRIITKMVSWAVCGTGTSREVRKLMEGKFFVF